MQIFLNWVSRNWRAIIASELIMIAAALDETNTDKPEDILSYLFTTALGFLIIKAVVWAWQSFCKLFTMKIVDDKKEPAPPLASAPQHPPSEKPTPPPSAPVSPEHVFKIIFIVIVAIGVFLSVWFWSTMMVMMTIGVKSKILVAILTGIAMLGSTGILPLMAAAMTVYKLKEWLFKDTAQKDMAKRRGFDAVVYFLLSNARALIVTSLIMLLIIDEDKHDPNGSAGPVVLFIFSLGFYFCIKSIGWGFGMLAKATKKQRINTPPVSPPPDPVQPE